VIKYILGLMIILGTPAIPGMVKEALGVKDMKGFPEMAMAGLGAGSEPVAKWWKTYSPYGRIMKEREALREGIYKTKYSDPNELAKYARDNTGPKSFREKLIGFGMPSYIKTKNP
jgi:hypothetical protein